MSKYQQHDGGRTRPGASSDCVVRALALATGKKYDTVYRWLRRDMIQWYGSQGLSKAKAQRISKPGVGREGVPSGHWTTFLRDNGWYRDRVTFERGSTVGDVANHYKNETVIVSSQRPKQKTTGHLCCIKKGTVLDTWDCRESRAVAVWRKRP